MVAVVCGLSHANGDPHWTASYTPENTAHHVSMVRLVLA
jgi:hypothetical protein